MGRLKEKRRGERLDRQQFRPLAGPVEPVLGASRMGVVNLLIAKRGYKRYLEIGCQFNAAFDSISADVKVGVDPVSGGTHRMTSDEFFAQLSGCEAFDVIFIDGDHRHPQVLRDIENALEHLALGGAIVMHDCLPMSAEYESPNLSGTAWRAFAKYRERGDLDAIVGDFDHGVGIIRVAPNPSAVELPCGVDELTYEHLIEHRDAWMRPTDLAGVEAFVDAWPDP